MIIVIRFTPTANTFGKFFSMNVCISYNCYISIELTISEGINVNKASASKKCDFFHYWYFSEKRSNFQLDVCNGCRVVLIMSIKLSDFAILNTAGIDYYCIVNRISKSEALNLLQNADFTAKSRVS